MNWAPLRLHPKAPSPFGDRLKLEAQAESDALALRVRFRLKTDEETFAKLDLPSLSNAPERKNELWKATCFECFILDGESDAYLEFNGSLTGDWNLYSFDAYRLGMKEVTLLPEPAPSLKVISKTKDSIEIEWSISRGLLPKGGKHLSLTAVLKTKNNEVSFWALTHQGEKPDFHLRSSFIYDSIWD